MLVEENFKESWPLRITHVENVQDMCARFVDDQSNVSAGFCLGAQYFSYDKNIYIFFFIVTFRVRLRS